MLQDWYSAPSRFVLYCQNLISSCVLFVCFYLFMLMCSHCIPPVHTFALNSRFSSHQCNNRYFSLALPISNLTYPEWKNSASLWSCSVITIHQVIQARNLEVILNASLLFFSHFQSHSIHHGFFHFSVRYQHLFPDDHLSLKLLSPCNWPPHLLSCLAAETGWEGVSQSDLMPPLNNKKRTDIPIEKWAKSSDSS